MRLRIVPNVLHNNAKSGTFLANPLVELLNRKGGDQLLSTSFHLFEVIGKTI